METSDAEEREAFHEQLNAVQEMPSKSDIAFVMGQLNAKVGSDTSMVRHMTGIHNLGDRYCIDFVIGELVTWS